MEVDLVQLRVRPTIIKMTHSREKNALVASTQVKLMLRVSVENNEITLELITTIIFLSSRTLPLELRDLLGQR